MRHHFRLRFQGSPGSIPLTVTLPVCWASELLQNWPRPVQTQVINYPKSSMVRQRQYTRGRRYIVLTGSAILWLSELLLDQSQTGRSIGLQLI